MCGGNICSWIEGHALNLDTTSMNSKHTGYSPSQVIWAIWGVSSPRQDVKLPLCGGKISPQLPVTGKPPPWADNPNPSVQKPRAGSLGLRLIWCDTSHSFPAWILRQGMVLAADHRSEWPAKLCSSQHNFGASPGAEQCWLVCSWELMLGEANRTMNPALCRFYPCQSVSQVVF